MIFDSSLDFAGFWPCAGRVLGVDLGTKKTGIAITNEGNGVALPLVLIRDSLLQNVTAEVEDLVKKYEISAIVIGFPFAYEEGEMARRIIKFAKMLEKLNLPILLYDEGGTSVFVRNQAFESYGKMSKKMLGSYDKQVAVLILQRAIDEINNIKNL